MRSILYLLTISSLVFVTVACQSGSSPMSKSEVKHEESIKNKIKNKLEDTSKTRRTEENKILDSGNSGVTQNSTDSQKTDDSKKEDVKRISVEEAKKSFDSGEGFFIDSRSNASYKREHIKGAVNITLADFESRYKEVPKDKKIIIYCS